MKRSRIFGILLLVLLLTSLAFALTSCKEKIGAPESLLIDEDTLTLTWRRVPGAKSYEILVEGDDVPKVTQSTYISLEYLDPGVYEIKVRAISPNEDIEPSDWSVRTFEKYPETGLKYKLINNRTEYQLTGIGTASGDIVMESEFRGKPVTSIADKALNNIQKVTSIVISKNVKEIGKSAFAKCNELISVSFEEGSVLESVGQYAFQSCKALQEVTFPDTLTVVPGYAFSWCSALKKVELGAATKSIDSYAFSNCESLEDINFPETLETIDQYAFSDCLLLDDIVLGDSLKSIADYAFVNCIGLKHIDLGNSLESIGLASFGGCVALNQIVIPDSVKSLGIQAFYACVELSDVTLGEGLSEIGGEAFYGTKALAASEDPDIAYVDNWAIASKNIEMASISLKEGTVGIADYAFAANMKLQLLNLSGVKHVGDYAFYGCTSLMGLHCDDALLSIGEYAFSKCTLLGTNEIKLGGSLVTIGNYAFEGCQRIVDNIDLPDTLRSIGTYAFNNTKAYNDAADVVYIDDWAVGIKSLMYTDVVVKDGTRGIANYAFYRSYVMYSFDIPDSVEYIGRGAFYECMYVSMINLPANLKEIGDYAFYSCILAWFDDDGITRIPEGTERIGMSAFNLCAKMVGVIIPGSVKTVGDFAFYKCESLGYKATPVNEGDPVLDGKVIIEEGVESIGLRVFHGCNLIEDIVIPDSVTHMDERVFYACESLKRVKIGSGLEYIPAYSFYGCANLTDVEFSDGVKVIGKYAFRGCISIRDLKLGEGIEEIGEYSFYGCVAVRDIVIPRSVKTVGKFAFRGCTGVSSVIIPNSVEVLGIHAFYGLRNASIFCEDESISAYWNERWNTSYRPVFWGCDLSDDARQVLSFVKSSENPENIESINGVADPYLEGFAFMGWSTTENGEVAYTADTLKDVPADTTLYPVFVETDYFIVFEPNKPSNASFDIEGVMLKLECLFERDFNLPVSEYSLVGWNFKGWATSPDGDVVYTDGEAIVDPLTTEGADIVTLYAVWEAKNYTIKYESIKPENASSELIGFMPDQIVTVDQDITLTPNQFSLYGWRFVGWSTIPFGPPMFFDEAAITIGANEEGIESATLYAVWTPINYYVDFNVNLPEGVVDYEGEMKPLICSYDTAYVIANEYVIDGYMFMGWATSPDGDVVYHDGEEILNLKSVDAERISVYAVWQKY